MLCKSLCYSYTIWSCKYSSCFEIVSGANLWLFYVRYFFVVYNFSFWKIFRVSPLYFVHIVCYLNITSAEETCNEC